MIRILQIFIFQFFASENTDSRKLDVQKFIDILLILQIITDTLSCFLKTNTLEKKTDRNWFLKQFYIIYNLKIKGSSEVICFLKFKIILNYRKTKLKEKL